MKTFYLFVALCVVSICGLGIIRPYPELNGDVHLKIPQGGAIVQPVSALNNTNEIIMNFIIDGQACSVNDPLIFYFDVMDTETGNNVILTFPFSSFYIHGCCGGRYSSVNIRYWEQFTLRTHWDGNVFADEVDISCCD